MDPFAPLLIAEKVDDWNQNLATRRRQDPLFRPDLRKISLAGKDLRTVNLENCLLTDADLAGTNLANANLKDAHLHRADVQGAVLRDADLTGAWLKTTHGVVEAQFSGACLAHAEMPRGFTFSGLKRLADVSKSARAQLFYLILGSSYGVLSTFSISDKAIVLTDVNPVLPFIQVPVPLSIFIYLLPITILLLTVFFLIHSQDLWREISTQPDIYPDCQCLNVSWPVDALLSKYRKHADATMSHLLPLRRFIAFIMSWCVGPLPLFCLYVFTVRTQMWPGIFISFLSLVGATFLANSSYNYVHNLFHKTRKGCWNWLLPWSFVLLSLVSGIFVIECKQDIWPAYLDVSREELSQKDKTVNWEQTFEDLAPRLKGVDLKNRTLRYMNADWSVLVGADLEGACLTGSSLRHADFRYTKNEGSNSKRVDVPGDTWNARIRLDKVDLSYAKLKETTLLDVDLRKADLFEADLGAALIAGADLRDIRNFPKSPSKQPASMLRVDLRGTYLSGWRLKGMVMKNAWLDRVNSGSDLDMDEVDLSNAYMRDASLHLVAFRKAILTNAHLERSDFSKAQMQRASLKNASCQYTSFYGADLVGANLAYTNFEFATLDHSDLSGAEIIETKFTEASLRSTNLRGVDLSGALGLTREQLKKAILDESTIMPDYLMAYRDEILSAAPRN